MIDNPKYRHKLNPDQLEVLELLYKFRYASSDLVAQYFGKKTGTFVYKRLKILQDQGLIGKRYDSTYRLQGKSAAYYLLPSGARKLEELKKPNRPLNIKKLYKNKGLSEQFIQHCFDILNIRNQLNGRYGVQMKFFTKMNLDHEDYDYFPQPLPDAYIRLESGEQFFLDVCHNDTPFFVHIRRIKQYINYAESGEWDDTGTDLPTIVLACDNPTLQKRLEKNIIKLENEIDDDELKFHVTSSPFAELPIN
jgi:hypothetical protein